MPDDIRKPSIIIIAVIKIKKYGKSFKQKYRK